MSRIARPWAPPGGLENGENAAGRGRILDLERDRSGGDVGLVRLVTGPEIGQAQWLRLGRGLGPDPQHEAHIGVRADPVERAHRRLEREGSGPLALEETNAAQRRADRVDIRLAVGPAPLAHPLECEHVVEWVERFRTVVADGADLGRDAEIDGDEVVHRRLVLVVTLRAAETAQDSAQAHLGQTRSQSISNSPSAAACRKRSMASPASRPRSLANVNGLTRNSAASSPVRMSVSNRDTTRGLQDRAASSRASRSSSVRSSTTVVIGLPPRCHGNTAMPQGGPLQDATLKH
jgi:hypothetical protein